MNFLEGIYPLHPENSQGTYTLGLFRSVLMRCNFDLHQRNLLGWEGLRPTCKGGEGWTCRIEGRPGVYGVQFREEIESQGNMTGKFELIYFPKPEEEILDCYPLQAALFMHMPDYDELVRDFLSYPDFAKWFGIGNLLISVDRSLASLSLVLESQKKTRSKASQEMLAYLKGHRQEYHRFLEAEEDLPAFDLSFPFFEVLAGSLAFALDQPVEWLIHQLVQQNQQLGLGFGSTDASWLPEELMRPKQSYQICRWVSVSEKERPFQDARWWQKGIKHGKQTEAFKQQKDLPLLIILTGFLGSGKTTFLKNLIEYHVSYSRFVAVIQNEIGKEGLDGSLLEDEHAVLEMDEGCVCCSLVGQLRKGIRKILDDYHPDIILLETTGLANPFNLLEGLDDIKDLVRFEGVTTLIDGLNFSKSTSFSQIAIDQVKSANQLILNKIDLIDKDQQEKILKQIKRLNPRAEIFKCSHGKANPAELYHAGQKAVMAQEKTNSRHQVHEDEDLGTKVCKFKKPLEKEELLSLLNSISASVLRVKGVVDIKGKAEPHIVQYVHGRYEIEKANKIMSKERFLVFIGRKNQYKQLPIFIHQKTEL